MRTFALTLLVVLFAGVAATDDSDSDQEGRKAINKVIKILTDMKTQLEKEAENDDEVMEKMLCWCETNDKAKTKAIADNTAKDSTLGAAIEEYTSSAATLKEEIDQLAKDIVANTKELGEATAIREKEAAEFAADEAEQLQSIEGLKNAITALGSKLSLRQQSLLQVTQDLQKSLHGHTGVAAMLKKLGMTAAQRSEVQSFLQTKAGTSSKTPGSSEILGVLKQMQENFETNLKEAQQTEADAVKAYKELKASKDAELQSCTDQSDSKTAQLAETVENLATAKQDLTDARAALEADTKFLADLKERCANMDAEFAERSKMRAEEITAVSEALNILTEDDARDQFGKSTKFIQASSRKNSASGARARATRLVQNAASKFGNPRFAALAVRMRAGDVFAKIKVAIDGMLTQLKQEQKDEVKHKDWCIEELNQNDRQTDDAYDKKKEIETNMEDLQNLLDNGDAQIQAMKDEIASMQVELKRASENREAENKDFQATMIDQRATQEILEKALGKLRAFYAKKALLQEKASHGKAAAGHAQAPPPGFGGAYKKNSGATGVMMMIEGVIKESKTVETEATAAEQEAQAAYESFIGDTNTAIAALQKGIAEKSDAVGKAGGDLARAKADLKANLAELEELSDYAGELHLSCDFTIKNFEVRQMSREREMEALFQAKAIMSGANIA